MQKNNNHEKGAIAILAVMMFLLTAIFFIFNVTDKLDSTLKFKLFLDKNAEIKKMKKEIEETLSNPASCKKTLGNQLGRTVYSVQDGSGSKIFGTPINPGDRDGLYKQVKLESIKSKLTESESTGARNKLGKGVLELIFKVSGNSGNTEEEEESIDIWVEVKKGSNNKLVSCSTAPPAHGSLSCEPIKAEMACCLFIYYINIPALDLLRTNNSITIDGFRTTKTALNTFNIDLNPKSNPTTYISKDKLSLIANPGSKEALLRRSDFKNNSNKRRQAIDIRMQRCNDVNGDWLQKHTGIIKAKCERGNWAWEGICDTH